jgi:hypothetical protein
LGKKNLYCITKCSYIYSDLKLQTRVQGTNRKTEGFFAPFLARNIFHMIQLYQRFTEKQAQGASAIQLQCDVPGIQGIDETTPFPTHTGSYAPSNAPMLDKPHTGQH